MCGNIHKWYLDDWHNNYEGAPTDGSPWLHGSKNSRVIRGGCYYSRQEEKNRCVVRHNMFKWLPRKDIGFRICKFIQTY